jgi:Ras-related GTP-binding protein A/B
MDLVPEHEREAVFLDRQKVILGHATSRFNFSVTFFKTSIWDETLYKAWSSIVYQLIPNVKALEHQLESLCEICGADEVGWEGGGEGGREGGRGRVRNGRRYF